MIVGAQSIEVLLLIYASYLMLGLKYNISTQVKLNMGVHGTTNSLCRLNFTTVPYN